MICKYAKPFDSKYKGKRFKCSYPEDCEDKVILDNLMYCGKEMRENTLEEFEVVYEHLERIVVNG